MEDTAHTAGHCEALAAEIARVTASPYPVSLKALHHLVGSAGLADLETWADQHQALVYPLAQALVEALPLWPYAMDLACSLAAVPDLGHALLVESPVLLDQLLTRAVNDGDAFEQVSGLCVALLARPLPPDVALPAPAQIFLRKLFDHALLNPCVASLERVCAVLDGACGSLLDLLSATDLTRFQEDLTRLMRSTKRFEGQLLSMLCLLLISKIPVVSEPASRCSPAPDQVSFEHPTELLTSSSPRSPSRFHKFFHGDAASKTLQLVALQVIYACRREADPVEAVKYIRVARLVAGKVEEGAMSSWVLSQSQIVQKLNEKSGQAQLPVSVRMEALAFSCTLSSKATLPKNMLAAVRRALTEDVDFAALPRSDLTAMRYVLDRIAANLLSDLWASLVRSMVSSVIGNGALGKQHAESLASLFDTLQRHVQHCKPLRRALLEMMSHNDSAEMLGRVLKPSKPSEAFESDLQVSVVSLFVSASLFSDVDDPSVPGSFATQLLTKQRALVQPTVRERRSLRRNSDEIRLPAPDKTQSGIGRSRFWRDQLFCELDAQAKRSFQSMLQIFGQSVLDMEARCEQTEEPLRAEQTMRENAEQRTKQAQQVAASLEQKLQNSQADVGRLQNLNDQMARSLEAFRLEAQAAFDQLESLGTRLEDATRTSEAQMAAAKHEHELEMLELETKVATQTEKVDDLEDQVRDLDTKLRQADSTVGEYRLLAEQSSAENSRLSTEHARLDTQIQALSEDLENVQAKLCESEAALQNLRGEKERDIQTALSEVKGRMAEAAKQAEQAKLEYIAHVNKLQEEADEAAAEHERAMADKDSRIATLKRKSMQLEEECRQKTSDLQREHDTRAKLLQTLGFNHQTPDMPAAKSRGESEAEASLRREGSPVPSDDQDATTTQPESPLKRQRPQRPFKVPRRRSVRVSGHRLGTQPTGVLSDVSGNTQACFETPKVQPATSAPDTAGLRRSSRRLKAPLDATGEQENRAGDERWDVTDLEGLDSQEFETTTVEF